MKSKIDWKRSEETLKAIIMDIVEWKEEYEKESSGEFYEGVIAGYEFVLESKKKRVRSSCIRL